MPAFDGRGPAGMGPMTGWGRGYCGPDSVNQGARPFYGSPYSDLGYGRAPVWGGGFIRGRGFFGRFRSGMGRGRRGGRGFGRRMGFRGLGW